MTDAVTISDAQKGVLMRRATRASVAVALTLVVIKTAAWVYTGSVALLGSLLDSFLDVVASGIMLIAVSHSLTPADRHHRFGHGKMEAIAGLGQAALIALSALYLLVQSVGRFIAPVAPTHGDLGIVVILVSILLTYGLVRYQRRVMEQTGSLAITADSLHYVGDLLMNAGVIVSLMAIEFGIGAYADAVMGIIICGILVKSVWSVASGAFNMLMDREMADTERERIKSIVLGHPDVRGIHDLRTRAAGLTSFIQFHIELAPDISLAQAHRISDAVEAQVAQVFPGADIIIHADPGYDGGGHKEQRV